MRRASRLPSFACITGANAADVHEMERICLDLREGDVAIFDHAYSDSAALWRLDASGATLCRGSSAFPTLTGG